MQHYADDIDCRLHYRRHIFFFRRRLRATRRVVVNYAIRYVVTAPCCATRRASDARDVMRSKERREAAGNAQLRVDVEASATMPHR